MIRLITFLILIIPFNSFSQLPSLSWAGSYGSTNSDQGQAVAIDSDGNIYTTGRFFGSVDFDPGTGVSTLVSSGDQDIYIQKLDSNGALVWAKRIGGSSAEFGFSIVVDSLFNVYVCGQFGSTVDFNPGVGVYNLTSYGSRDAFVLKLNNSGDFVWAGRFGGSSWDGARTVIINNSGDLLISGWFHGTADFNVGAGVNTLTSSGNHDGYILKMSTQGTFIWAKKVGGSSFDTSYGMSVDNSDNIYIAGEFSGTADFNPSSATNSLTSSGGKEGYILKLNNSGLFQWVKKIGGSGNDLAIFTETDSFGNVYMSGRFSNTVDFDPGFGQSLHTSVGSDDAMIIKLSPAGVFLWGQSFGSINSETGQGLVVDKANNVYFSGAFHNVIDFNNGLGVSNLTSIGNRDLFIVKLNSAGGYLWAKSIGGSGEERNKEIKYNSKNGTISIVGWFRNTVDFDFNIGTNNLVSSGNDDIFVATYQVCSPTTSAITAFACSSYTSPSGNHTWTTSGIYTDVFSNAAGCDSTMTIYLTINDTYFTQNIINCGTYVSPSGNYTWTTSGTYLDTIPNSAGCDSIITTNLTINSHTTATLNPVTCGTYSSPSGNYQWNTSGTYYDTIPSGNGCNIIFTINLTVNSNTFSTTNATACNSYSSPSGNYQWNTSGTYLDTIPNSHGCDSIMTFNLIINQNSSSTISPVVCANYTSPSGNYIWTLTGTYLDTIPNSLGCDSLITIQLTVNNSFSSISSSACNSYTSPSGKTWITSGIYQDTVLNNLGCDSIITINLTVNTSDTTIQNTVACNSYLWSGNGFTYLSSGTYLVTLTNSGGCDSVVTLYLTINNSSSSAISVTTCDSYTSPSGNNTWSSSGTYTDIVSNNVGCDSVITISLTILNSSSYSETTSSCNFYTWSANNITYRNSGVYSATLVNSVGCDSNVTLNLTITTNTSSVENVVACNSYTWLSNGTVYYSGGQYLDTLVNSNGCDSLLTLNLTINQPTISIQSITACDAYTSPSSNYVWTNSGTYLDTVLNANGCDSIITTILTINSSTSANQVVASCDSYVWAVNNQTYTSSGNYFATLTNAIGCDSNITLALTINNSSSNTVTIVACDTFTWTANGVGYNTSGVYPLTFTNSFGCDSVVTLNLTINQSNSSTQNVTACNSYSWVANSITYLSSGVYLATLQNVNGCDSVITLNLTINNSTIGTQMVTACNSYISPSGNYTWITSGSYMDTITNGVGCDSIITINLTVNYGSLVNDTVTACDSYVWAANNMTFVNSGNYSITVTNGVGCDSISNLYLTINSSDSVTENISACGSYTWGANGVTYSNSGVFIEVLTNGTGCDSTVTLNLTILSPSTFTQTVVACDNYTWVLNGINYNTSGTYVDTTTNSLGCDSIVTLDLTVNSNSSSTLNESSCGVFTAPDGVQYATSGQYFAVIPNVMGCDSNITINLSVTNIDTSVSVNGFVLTANALGAYTYQWLDCDNGNSPISGSIGQSFTPIINGNYAVEISDGVCLEQSNCIKITGVGISSVQLVGVSLFPNPVFDYLNVDRGDNSKLQIFVIGNSGQVIKSFITSSQITKIDFSNYSPGVYFIKIKTSEGIAVERVVKR